MKLKTKLTLLVLLFTLAFGAFWALSYAGSEAVKMNGPYYHQIVDGKDLIADILPPPAYIIEAFLTARQISDPNYRAELPALVAKSRQLRLDYDTRHEFWLKKLPAQTDEERLMRTRMLETSYQPAIRFLETVQSRLIPATRAGNYPAARTLIYGPLQSDYNLHAPPSTRSSKWPTPATRASKTRSPKKSAPCAACKR